MQECQLCKSDVAIIYNCNYCKQRFCSEHRLPEKHLCPNMPSKKNWRKRNSQIDRKKGYVSRLRNKLFKKK